MGFNNPQQVKGIFRDSLRHLADIFLQAKINGDMPLLQAIEKLLLEDEEKNPGSVFDHDFIGQKTIPLMILKSTCSN